MGTGPHRHMGKGPKGREVFKVRKGWGRGFAHLGRGPGPGNGGWNWLGWRGNRGEGDGTDEEGNPGRRGGKYVFGRVWCGGACALLWGRAGRGWGGGFKVFKGLKVRKRCGRLGVEHGP